MNQRDREIIRSLEQFKVMERDHIIKLHFADQKQPITTANRVLKRLNTIGAIKRSTAQKPYCYFPAENRISADSIKLKHYLEVTQFIVDANEYGKLEDFMIEPILGKKGTVEPDAFMLWQGVPCFVEMQRTRVTLATIQEKLNRYKAYHVGGNWKNEFWQQDGKPDRFPFIMLITPTDYRLTVPLPLKVYQAKDMKDFIGRYMTKEKEA